MRKQTKIAALVSAAALLAIGASMTSFADWVGPLADGSYEYHDSYGEAVTGEWRTGKSSRDGQTYYYYLDDNGKMAVDSLVEYNGNLYYVNENGERVADYWYKVANTEGITVNEIEPANLYYYFNTKGQAVTGKNNIRKSNTDATKCDFQFDSEYHMISGWYGDYYCSGEDEGYVLTGWQELQVPDPDAVDTGDPYEDDPTIKWYYFKDGAKLKSQRAWLEWDGKYSYYTFNENGTLIEEGWSNRLASTASPATASVPAYYGDGGARMKGWVLTKKDPAGGKDFDNAVWYYLSSTGIPFNYHDTTVTGAVETIDGKTLYEGVAARLINNKTYLFDNDGEMLTGIYRVKAEVTITGSTKKLEANDIYYFDTEEGGPEGSMVTRKVTKTDEDITRDYYFGKTGKGAENEIVGGVLYGVNGVRVNAMDSTWETKDIDEDTTITSDKKKDSKQEDPDKLSGCTIIVNTNGRVKDSGTVTIEGVRYYIKNEPSNKATLDGYHSYVDKDGVPAGVSYVVVGYVNVD